MCLAVVAVVDEFVDMFDLLRRQLGFASEFHFPALSCLHPGTGPFAYLVRLVDQSSAHAAACGRSCVDGFGKRMGFDAGAEVVQYRC